MEVDPQKGRENRVGIEPTISRLDTLQVEFFSKVRGSATRVGGNERGTEKKIPSGTNPEPLFHAESQFGFLVKPVLARLAEYHRTHIPGICDYITWTVFS